MPVLIRSVEPDSHASRAGIYPGDTLLSVDKNEISDVLDYRFHITGSRLELSLLRGGAAYLVWIKKPEYDDLGLEFDTYLMDKQKTCKNKCIFCFVDQMAPGMRETLYFKDDDSRLSFLFGNYITLTNLTDADVERIIKMHISPVNISVHTTSPELRVAMMKNPAAAESLRYVRQLTDAGIRVNTQLVLCPGINDGQELERTLRDLGAGFPNLQSIACVPVGLTKFREGLPALSGYTREGAAETIEIIHRFAEKMLREHGERVAYPSDEFFLRADQPIPPSEYYGDFDQLENGVGLIALLRDEFADALDDDAPVAVPDGGEPSKAGAIAPAGTVRTAQRPVAQSPTQPAAESPAQTATEDSGHTAQTTPHLELSLATGTAAYPLISALAASVMERHPEIRLHVYAIQNRFFGETITVAGLVTGGDLADQLAGKPLGERLLIPSVMLRHERDKFLDDMTPDELEKRLGLPVTAVDNDGYQLYAAMTGRTPAEKEVKQCQNH